MLTSTSASVLPAMARSQLRKSVPTHSRISAVQQLPRVSCRPAFLSEKRHFSRTTSLAYPRKDSQDRESINTEATEYSKSGTDDEAARREDAAFNPDLTDPESQKAKAGESNKEQNNPLEVSPANSDVSKQRAGTEGGAENSSSSSGGASDRQRSSGGGSPPKGRKVS